MTEDELRHPKDLPDALTTIAVLVERLRNRDMEIELQTKEYEKGEDENREWRRIVDDTLTALKTRRDSNLIYLSVILSVMAIAAVVWQTLAH